MRFCRELLKPSPIPRTPSRDGRIGVLVNAILACDPDRLSCWDSNQNPSSLPEDIFHKLEFFCFAEVFEVSIVTLAIYLLVMSFILRIFVVIADGKRAIAVVMIFLITFNFVPPFLYALPSPACLGPLFHPTSCAQTAGPISLVDLWNLSRKLIFGNSLRA